MAKKILVVEDEPSLAKILKFDLETAGFVVKNANNGTEAYRMVQKEKFDCFIIDWMIPNMSGLDLIKKLRAEKNKGLFVMLTAKNHEGDTLDFSNILLDLKQFKVFVNQKPIELTKMEFDLLKFFIVNKEQALSRDTILNAIWGYEYDGTTRIVDVHVYNLKRKLIAAECFFKPVRGVGYSLLLK